MAVIEKELLDEQAGKPLPVGAVTYEEFLEWADEDDYAEWVDGKIELMSPASLEHQEISTFILRLIAQHVEDYRIGKIIPAPFQMKLGDIKRGREPDIIFVAHEHFTRLQANYLDGPADLAVEIASPESVLRDRGAKYGEYEAAGVREYWIIDPMTQRADFFLLDSSGRYQRATPDSEGVYRSVVLEGFSFNIHWLWQNPLPSLREISGEYA